MAAKIVTIEEAQRHLDELIENANAGDELILSRGDEPVPKVTLLPKPKEEVKERRK